MELVYAALLLHKSGKEINETNLKSIMHAAQIQVDDSKVKALVAALEGIDIEKAIKEAAFVSAPASSGEAVVEKKEEKKEEKKDETQAAAGLGALFG